MSTSTSFYILVLICILTVNTNTNTDTNAPTKLLTHVPRVWCMRPQYKACQKYTLYIYCKSFLYRLSSCVVCFVYIVMKVPCIIAQQDINPITLFKQPEYNALTDNTNVIIYIYIHIYIGVQQNIA